MSNPVLVEVVRGPLVESRHRGAVAIADARGEVKVTLGDTGALVFPRSAVKALQALAAVESGAADAVGSSEEEIALACASHNGEPIHVAAARAMLAKAGFSEADLECGPHPPRVEADLVALRAGGGEPGRVHNNCSGKHAAMLTLARHMGLNAAGYSRRDHPVQEAIRGVMSEMIGVPLAGEACAMDGCSVPTWAMPLGAMAVGFARFASGEGLPATRAAACARIRNAVAANPFMVAGTGRFCTELMEAAGATAFVKTGAEGVFCAALPERGLGIALKIDDGTARASQAVMAEIVLALCGLSGAARRTLERLARPIQLNWAGLEVGEIRTTAYLKEGLGPLTRQGPG